MSDEFLSAVKEGDVSYVAENVQDIDKKTLNKALSIIKVTIKNFKNRDSDYSSVIEDLETIQNIVKGQL